MPIPINNTAAPAVSVLTIPYPMSHLRRDNYITFSFPERHIRKTKNGTIAVPLPVDQIFAVQPAFSRRPEPVTIIEPSPLWAITVITSIQ